MAGRWTMSTQHISFGFDGEESDEEEQRRVEGILRLDSQTFQLLEGENAVGRGETNDIILDDQSVSDSHAVITVLPGGASVLVKDLDSTNKTRCQTEGAEWEVIKAKKPVTLSHGAKLRFGALEAAVLLGTESVMAAAPTQAVNELGIEDEATDDEGAEADGAGLRNEVTQAVPEFDEDEEEEAKGVTVAQSHDSSPATVPMKVVGEEGEGDAAPEEKHNGGGAAEEEEEGAEGDDASSHVSADLMGAETFVSDAEEEEEEAVGEGKAEGEVEKDAEPRVSVAPSEHTAVEEEDTATEGEEEEEVEEETAQENHSVADANISAADANIAAAEAPENEMEAEKEAEEVEGTAVMDVQNEEAPPEENGEGEGEEKEQGGLEGSDGDETPSGPPTPNTLPPPTHQKAAGGAAARGQIGSPILEEGEEYQSGEGEEMDQEKGEGDEAEKKPDDVEDDGKYKEPEVQQEEEPGDKTVKEAPAPKRGRKKAEADVHTDEEAAAPSRKPRGKAAGSAKALTAEQPDVVEEEAQPEAKPEAKGAGSRKPRGKAKAAESHADVQEGQGHEAEGDKQNEDAEAPTTGRQGRGRGRAAANAKEPSQPVEDKGENEEAAGDEKATGREGKRGRKGLVIKQEKKEAGSGKEQVKEKGARAGKEKEKEAEQEGEKDEVAEEAAGGRGARRGRKAPVVVKQEKGSGVKMGKDEAVQKDTQAKEKDDEVQGEGEPVPTTTRQEKAASTKKGKGKAAEKDTQASQKGDDVAGEEQAEPTTTRQEKAAGTKKGKGKAAEKDTQASQKGDDVAAEGQAEPTTTRAARGRGAKREVAAAVKEEKEAGVATGASKRARRGVAEETPAEEDKPQEEGKKGKGKAPVVKKEPVASRSKKAAETEGKEDDSAMQVEEESEAQPKRGRKRPPPAGHVPLAVVKEEKPAAGKKARGSSASQPSEPPGAKGRRSTTSRAQDGEDESQASALSMQLREGQQHRLRVAFSGVKAEQREKTILQNLSCELVDDVSQADVLIAASLKDGIKFGRRPKALACLARGLPIVDLSWLDACAKDNTVLRPGEHVLVDKEAEKRWGFGMGESLDLASAGRLLDGWAVLVVSKKMGSGMPSADDFQLMVEAAGARWMGDKPKVADVKAAGEEHVLIISDEASLGDAKLQALAHQAAEAKDTHVYSLEALLSGLLRQKLSLKDNILWRNPAAFAEGKGKGGKAAGAQPEAGSARASRRTK